MTRLLFSRWGMALIAAAVALGTITGAYWLGHSSGVQKGREAALSRSVDILRERARTDEQIRTMDDAALCRALGGVMSDGSCV